MVSEDAFDQAVKIIAEVSKKIMGTETERKERERINEEVFSKKYLSPIKSC